MWINPITQQTFATHSAIRQAFPQVSMPADITDSMIAEMGLSPLTVTEPPAHDPATQTVVRDGCEFVTGEWRQKWVVIGLDASTIAANLTAARATKCAAIRAERDRRKFNGVLVSGKWIHTDTYSRTQWMGMVMMGASIPTIEWTTMDDTAITTSQALAGQVFNATATLDATLFNYARTLMASVDASSMPDSVDIVIGWPATFEG